VHSYYSDYYEDSNINFSQLKDDDQHCTTHRELTDNAVV